MLLTFCFSGYVLCQSNFKTEISLSYQPEEYNADKWWNLFTHWNQIYSISYIIFHAQAHTLINQVTLLLHINGYMSESVLHLDAFHRVISLKQRGDSVCETGTQYLVLLLRTNTPPLLRLTTDWLKIFLNSCICGKARIIPLDQSIHKGVSVFKYLYICIFYALNYLFSFCT